MAQIYREMFIKIHFTDFIIVVIVGSVGLRLMLMIIEERIIVVHLFIYVEFHFQSQVRLFTFYKLLSLMEINRY